MNFDIISEYNANVDIIVSDDNDRYICGFCSKYIIDCYQVLCGCRFCNSCCKEIQQSGNKCPNNYTLQCKKYNFEPSKDEKIDEEIMEITVECWNSECDFSGTLFDLKEHIVSCLNYKWNGDDEDDVVELPQDKSGLELVIKNLITENKKLKEQVKKLECTFKSHFKNKKVVYVWKIDNISKIISGRKEVRSDEFYTDKFGYCMRLVVQIFGEYLSVYFELLEGQYDDILNWPFRKDVILSIKKNCDEEYSEEVPCSAALSVDRPTSFNTNNLKGYPEFIDLSELNSYIIKRNNAIIITCSIKQ